jgi:chromosome segregation protein
LEIARRIERDSGSNYRINGRDVRARDVQIFLRDASTGARSPALVPSGAGSERSFSAKPEQPPACVLEEAAGIAGLHARRHEPNLGLKAADNQSSEGRRRHRSTNPRRIDGLKKQARQAIRYRTVSSQVRKAEARPSTIYAGPPRTARLPKPEQRKRTSACAQLSDRVGAEAEASKSSGTRRGISSRIARSRSAGGRRTPPPGTLP